MVLGAAEALHALSVGAAGRIDVFGNRGRADKADRLDARIGEQRIDRLLVAVDHIEDAGGQARLEEQLGNPHRHRRIALGRLEDEGIAAGDRGRALPQRDHRREIERGDAGDDAERLAERIKVDAGAGVVAEFALHQMRDAAGEFDHLEAALDVALGVDEGLAVLGGQQPRQVVVFGLHQLQELEHHPGAPLRVGRGPGRLRRGGVGDGAFDLGFAGESDLGLDLAGVRVEHVAGPAGAAFDLFAADEVANVAHDVLLERCPAGLAAPAVNRSLTIG